MWGFLSSLGEQRVELEGKVPKDFSKEKHLQRAVKDQGLWVAVIPSGSLEPMLSSLTAHFHYEWLFSRGCDAVSLSALWGLSAHDFKDEDPGIRKLLGHRSRLEEHDCGFCVKCRVCLCLGWINSGFWAAWTSNWS